ncbi:MAG TPA: hypothetical protein VEK79_16795 [Thermoanaerobaculia bacterium]|nr:hypothetical protein [Thermoanaerobaculia bacterium]
MIASTVVYSGLALAFTGFVCLIGRKRGALAMIAGGLALTIAGLLLPARESRIARVESRLDEFMPVWQFNEVHSMYIDAPPARVYEAIRHVRADEIALFRTLTWIRRCGRDLPPGILNPGEASLIDVATSTTFIFLAADAPRELAVGTIIARSQPRELTPQLFRETLPPGFTLAAMNFIVRPDGAGSLVTTETRVFANSDRARRRFAMYWRAIYPGSALIRRMWLRAVARRAEAPA